MDFAEIVRRKREERFKTPTEFHRKAELSCSFFSYTEVEKGKTHPKIDLALEIIRKLEIPERQGLLAWARGHMPDDASASVFTEADADAGNDYGDFSRPLGSVLSGAQVKYLVGDGPHVDIVRYLMGQLDTDGVKGRELAKTFGIEHRRMVNLLAGLEEQGLVEKLAADVYRARGRFNLPSSPEATAVKHALFERTAKLAAVDASDEAYRAVLTRRLSPAQFEDLKARLAAFVASADALPSPATDDKTFTIGVFALSPAWSSS